MKIRMLKTTPGSIDGIRVKSYEVDTEHDLTATPGERSLAAALVTADLAEEVGAEPEKKVVSGPAENKRRKHHN